MTIQGVLVESVFSGLTGEVGNFVNKRISGGRVAFHPSSGGNTYKDVYASATVGGSTLLDQSVNQGILLDGSGSAEVYAVGHYSCKVYDSEGVLQRTFDLRIGSVTSDSSGDSSVSTNTLNIKTSYGTTASDINNAITYANANSANSFVFLFEDANFTLENNMIFPSNATIQVEPTAKLMIYAGVNAITINGEIRHDFNQIFKYENNTTCTVTISPKAAEHGYPQWFGAIPDGTSDSRFAVDRLLQTGINRVVIAGGNFKLNSNLTIPSTVEIIRKGGADFTLASGVTVSGLGTKATVFDKVEVKGNLVPTTTETSDIGSSTKKIQKVYAKDIDVDSILQILSQLKLGDGTLSSLALSAISDPNTGLYFPVADVLALVTGGVERLRVDNSEIHIVGNNYEYQFIIKNNENTYRAAPDLVLYKNSPSPSNNDNLGVIHFKGNNSSGISKDYAAILTASNTVTSGSEAGSMGFFTMSNGVIAERMKITSAGNVGIGTANPILPLTLKGAMSFEATNSTDYWVVTTHTDNSLLFNFKGVGSDELKIKSDGKIFMPSLGTGTGTTGLSVKSDGEIVKGHDSTVTQQGNSFNAANQLVKLDANQDVSIGGKVTATGGIDAGGSGTFLKTKVIDIGSWSYTTAGYSPPIVLNHGLTKSNIRSFSTLLFQDSGDSYDPTFYAKQTLGSSQITIEPTGSANDWVSKFSNTSMNRGYVTILYET